MSKTNNDNKVLKLAIEHLRMSELTARSLGCDSVAVGAGDLALLLKDYDRLQRESSGKR